MKEFKPEGQLIRTPENRAALASPSALANAFQKHQLLEGRAVVCDGAHDLMVDLGCMRGVIPREEGAIGIREGTVKDIAIISRVNKPVCFYITGFTTLGGRPAAMLSRRAAQRDCLERHLMRLCAGDIIPGRVTHMEPFGAFLDIGCGVSSLLSVDCISVSRISHPHDRLSVGMLLPVAVRNVDRENGRIAVTLRELLGTWEENAAGFSAGQTVTGIVRSVESYGVFIELAPNLAGLAEVRGEEQAETMRALIGHAVAVYIKSVSPERMKVKLVVVDTAPCRMPPKAPVLFVDAERVKHLDRWVYSPACCGRRVETVFGSSEK